MGRKELEKWNKTIKEQYIDHNMELPIATSGPVTVEKPEKKKKTVAGTKTATIVTTEQVFVIRDAYDDDVAVRKALQDQHLKLYSSKPTFSEKTEAAWVRGVWKWWRSSWWNR